MKKNIKTNRIILNQLPTRNKSNRCAWVSDDPLYIHYHDHEWGVPIYDNRLLFEFLNLEGMQAGLSWLTVLKKREAFRVSFDNFEAERIREYKDSKIKYLLQNPQIIRNRLKINAVIQNAKSLSVLEEVHGSLSKFLWDFVGGKPIVNQWEDQAQVPSSTALSDQLSKALQAFGFKFVGTTICYAFMQAVGLVDDHINTCFIRQKNDRFRK